MPSYGLLVLGIAITHLHPGAGRAPGVVDLPVTRDSLGYPMLYASSLKGALKSLCAKRLCVKKDGTLCVDKQGRIVCTEDCNPNCKLCCCLFGPEPGERDGGSGVLSVLDFIPFAFPAPSADMGYVYVTTPLLLKRVESILDALHASGVKEADKLHKEVKDVLNLSPPAAIFESQREVVDIAGSRLKLSCVEKGKLQELGSLVAKLGGLAPEIAKRLVIVGDEVGPSIIEKTLLRVTRVRLRRDRKTVVTGALWTEEYIPAGTLFIGGFIGMFVENKYCETPMTSEKLKRLIEEFKTKVLKTTDNITYFTVGGKETVGRGLIKILVL